MVAEAVNVHGCAQSEAQSMFLIPSPLLQGPTATRRPASPSTPTNGAAQSSRTAPRPLLAVRRITPSVTEASVRMTGTDRQGRSGFALDSPLSLLIRFQ